MSTDNSHADRKASTRAHARVILSALRAYDRAGGLMRDLTARVIACRLLESSAHVPAGDACMILADALATRAAKKLETT